MLGFYTLAILWFLQSYGSADGFPVVDCSEKGGKKRTFPDLGYALMGYNKQKAYPLNAGHDPGFQQPIFKRDFSQKRQTADCIYSVPDGWFINPDVSCQTSMTSTTITTSEQLREAMSFDAEVEASGWGASFSASTEFNKMKETLDVNENVIVLAKANCQYYYMKMNEVFPPKFTKAFLWWLKKLQATSSLSVYQDFIDYFGTHFIKEATFGARFTREYQMTKEQKESLEEQDVDVNVAASYSGFGVKVKGSVGYSRSKSQQSKSLFENSVMKTLSVGATPPADGDALKWASSVQDFPLPFSYKLCNIDELFTERYMGEYMWIDYNFIRRNLDILKNGRYVVGIARITFDTSPIGNVSVAAAPTTPDSPNQTFPPVE